MFNDTITIYSKYNESGTEKWKRTVVYGVMWSSVKGATFRKTGVASADGTVITIPHTADAFSEYVTPKRFAEAPNKLRSWTIQQGDVVIKGAVFDEVVKSSSELITKYDSITVVTSADERLYCSDMAHLEVSGR